MSLPVVWPELAFNFSRTCLSLSLAFPLPDTRDEVTSRGMTEIWCSGMFIPAEPTRDALTHAYGPDARTMSMMVRTATPCRTALQEDTHKLATREY